MTCSRAIVVVALSLDFFISLTLALSVQAFSAQVDPVDPKGAPDELPRPAAAQALTLEGGVEERDP